jgi:hypothetical protein
MITHLIRPLTTDEKASGSAYCSDSTFFHLCALGLSSVAVHDPRHAALVPAMAAHFRNIDASIAASSLTQPLTVYSGHGNGLGIIGALEGVPAQFVGLRYSYNGYISTSSVEGNALRFLETRYHPALRPVMLKLIPPVGFNTVDVHHFGHAGEMEFLVGRRLTFSITGAYLANHGTISDILVLVLHP